MKYILASFLTVMSSFAAADELVKACSFELKMPGDSKVVPSTYQIIKNGTTLLAKTVQTIDGQSVELPNESVQITEHVVRSGLTAKTKNMNEAEQLIIGTIEFLQNPEFGKAFNVGVDLSQVRSAKVYRIGKFTHMGGMAIVEAKGANGNNLGSFVTGFMPFACTR